MNQKHLDLAKKFNSFAYDLVTNTTTIKGDIKSLADDELYRRVVFNKFYYALYHKYLAHDSKLSVNTGSSKHNAILNKIKACGDLKLFQTYTKLLNLRVWADYGIDNDPHVLSINLISLNRDVWNIIKRKNINC